MLSFFAKALLTISLTLVPSSAFAQNRCFKQNHELNVDELFRGHDKNPQVMIRTLSNSFEFIDFRQANNSWLLERTDWLMPISYGFAAIHEVENTLYLTLSKPANFGCPRRSLIRGGVGKELRSDEIFDHSFGVTLHYYQRHDGTFKGVNAEMLLFCSSDQIVRQAARSQMLLGFIADERLSEAASRDRLYVSVTGTFGFATRNSGKNYIVEVYDTELKTMGERKAFCISLRIIPQSK